METFEFKEVIEALEQGKIAARLQWNSFPVKSTFVFKQIPAKIEISRVPTMQSLPESVKNEFLDRNEDGPSFDSIYYVDQLCIVFGNNFIKGYCPSPEDIFADDWLIFE